MTHRKIRRSIVAIFINVLLAVSALAQVAPPSEKPLRVLFIGNSYTYFNNLPEMFAKLAQAGLQKPVIYEMQAPGGVRLKDHWDRAETRKALEEQKWDYVVLQDQSLLGTNYYYEGKPRIPSDELFHTYALQFVKAIREAGAIPVFYLTWARKVVPEDQAALTSAYMRAAKETKSIVAPVGIAWADVESKYPAINLFYQDGSHPSSAGTYLNACVFYATLFGRSPAGLPSQISGPPMNLETAKPDAGKTAILVNLPAEQARKLQEAAWRASVALRKNGGYLPSTAISPPPLSPLPAGEKLDKNNLEGTWSGRILFYPVGPVDMTLQLQSSATGWTGHLELQYHAKDVADESLEVADLNVGEAEITFTDPKSAHVGNLPVHFRAVLTPGGQMVGTAETSGDKPDAPMKVLGDWKLTRN